MQAVSDNSNDNGQIIRIQALPVFHVSNLFCSPKYNIRRKLRVAYAICQPMLWALTSNMYRIWTFLLLSSYPGQHHLLLPSKSLLLLPVAPLESPPHSNESHSCMYNSYYSPCGQAQESCLCVRTELWYNKGIDHNMFHTCMCNSVFGFSFFLFFF